MSLVKDYKKDSSRRVAREQILYPRKMGCIPQCNNNNWDLMKMRQREIEY